MQTHVPAQADQTKQQQNKVAPQPTQTVGEQQGEFVDNRPEMAAGLQLRQLMDSSRQAVGGRALQAMINNSAQAREGRAMQAMMNKSTLAREAQSVQLMLNTIAQANPPVQRVEEEEPLQAKATNEHTTQLETAAEAPKPNNTGLPDNLKSGIESLSGMSMDHVKVHYNSSQPAQLNAHAYAQGSEIHVAPGQEQHVPHEAWHVVQQAQGRVKPTVQMKSGVPVNDDVGLESEADVMGARALGMGAGAVQMKKEGDVGMLELTPSPLQARQLRVTQTMQQASAYTMQLKIMQAMMNSETSQRAQKESHADNKRDVKPKYPCPQTAQTVTQRLVNVNGRTWDIEMGSPVESPTKQEVELYRQWLVDDEVREFRNTEDFEQNLQWGVAREQWWNNTDVGILELNHGDPLFQKIAFECIQNHDEKPYSTDSLHETGPITGGYMSSKGFLDAAWKMSSALTDKTIWTGKNVTERPHFEITRIQMIKNTPLLLEFEKAKEEMKSRGQAPNARSLYSGHGPDGMEYITAHGHDPSYGSYDKSMKGHGAHGRGAYFTDQVDKAVSYSRKDQGEREERSFFKQDVLLGNSYEYKERGRFRHQHHNEMTKLDRSKRNKAVIAGSDAETEMDMSGIDSLKGIKTYESGAGLLGTYINSEKFDSDEYMVRNADQIYVKFRIFYKLADHISLNEVKSF